MARINNTPPEPFVLNPTFQRGTRLYVQLKSQQEGRRTEFDSSDDFVDDLKQTLVAHVARSTEKGNNPSVVNSPSDFGLTDGLGNPTLVPADLNGQQTYTSGLSTTPESSKAVSRFNDLSRTGMLDTAQSRFFVRRGRETSTARTGTELYTEVSEKLERSEVAERVQASMLGNNHYNSSNKFFNNESSVDEVPKTILGNINPKLGEHGPRKFPSTVTAREQDLLTIAELKRAGVLALFKSTGKGAIEPSPSASDTELQALSLLPTITQATGLKMPVSRFSPLLAIRPGSTAKTSNNGFINPDQESYGNNNTPFLPFSGLLNVGGSARAVLLSGMVGGLLLLFSREFITRGRSQSSSSTNNSRFPKGTNRSRRGWLGNHNKPVPETPLGAITRRPGISLNILDTEHPFVDCLNAGTHVFFGFDNAATIPSNHGYYNNILRSVVGSIQQIVDGSKSLGESVTNIATFDPIEMLNGSMAMKFINVLLAIGDRTISALEAYGLTISQLGTDLESQLSLLDDVNDKVSIVIADGLPAKRTNNPAILQSITRLSDSGMSTMGNTSIPSLLLTVDMLDNQASRALGKLNDLQTLASTLRTNNFDAYSVDMLEPSRARIKQEVLKKFENYLEADYVPFWFHDVRTNEIIALHAFLENVTDNLSVDYGSTNGYGRVDPVYTYKSTTRTVGLEFSVVSTNNEDFDQMWYKVNRLATMCYPQWTKGRQVSTGTRGEGGRFIQPFSQLPGASPLVRIRLGDMLKTNYSKFAVARLFGLADPESRFNANRVNSTQPGDANNTEARTRAQNIATRIEQVVQRQTRKQFEPGDIVRIVPNSRIDTVTTSITTARNTTTRRTVTLEAKGTIVEQRINTVVLTNLRRTDGSPYEFGSTASNQQTVSGTTRFEVPVASLEVDRDEIVRSAVGSAGSTSTEQQNQASFTTDAEILEFFNENNNPVLKSFASTKGKGLAGFIKSFNLDYKEATWVTDRLNSKAPMVVKINLEFAPIHDIAPGLDSNGIMTAPIWDVGNAMKRMGDSTTSSDSRKAKVVFNSATSVVPTRT